MRILILGGTAEASALSEKLAGRPGLDVTLSLAGRTANPRPSPVATRIGGFGGAEGLRGWLDEHGTDLVVDATHPFAAVISRNANTACEAIPLPLLALRRSPWIRQAGDRWTSVSTMAQAAEALGSAPRRVFVTVGRQELAAFNIHPQHTYVVRSIEPAGHDFTAPHVTALRARGPFDEDGDLSLMVEHGIEILVTKNSGGTATYAKITAARSLGLPVIMVSQPAKPYGQRVETVGEALDWIEEYAGALGEIHGRFP
jgi:precorrin-6A/cobalt-precorrin-6A reductase